MLKRLCIAALVLVLAVPAAAGSLPKKFGYTIYSKGEHVGNSNTTVTEKGDLLILETKTHVQFTPEIALDLTSRTEADKNTFLVRHFSYKGTKGEAPLEGEITVDGDSLYGYTINADWNKEDYHISPFERNLFLEDYVMSHEVLLARSHMAGGEKSGEYGMMLPSSMALGSCTVLTASKAEIESDEAAVVCEKVLIAISGSEPFASFYDPDRGMPVYLAFPQTYVEVFLDDFFGDSPVSRYRSHENTE